MISRGILQQEMIILALNFPEVFLGVFVNLMSAKEGSAAGAAEE